MLFPLLRYFFPWFILFARRCCFFFYVLLLISNHREIMPLTITQFLLMAAGSTLILVVDLVSTKWSQAGHPMSTLRNKPEDWLIFSWFPYCSTLVRVQNGSTKRGIMGNFIVGVKDWLWLVWKCSRTVFSVAIRGRRSRLMVCHFLSLFSAVLSWKFFSIV